MTGSMHEMGASVSQSGKQYFETPMQKVLGSIRKVRFSQSTLRQASILEKQGPSFGKIQVEPQLQRSPNGVKFEARSLEETVRQQLRCAQCKAWNLARNIFIEGERRNYILLVYGKVGLLVASRKETKERFCRGFLSEHAYGQQAILQFC